MPGPDVLKLESLPETCDQYYLAPDKLLAGNPRQALWMDYTDASGQFFVGTWRSEPGKWRISYTEEEFCHMQEGISVITDDAGRQFTVRAGDRFVIPRGFSGTWEVVEASTKRFVIFEAAPPADPS